MEPKLSRAEARDLDRLSATGLAPQGDMPANHRLAWARLFEAIDRFEFFAKDAVTKGSPSYGVHALSARHLELTGAFIALIADLGARAAQTSAPRPQTKGDAPTVR